VGWLQVYGRSPRKRLIAARPMQHSAPTARGSGRRPPRSVSSNGAACTQPKTWGHDANRSSSSCGGLGRPDEGPLGNSTQSSAGAVGGGDRGHGRQDLLGVRGQAASEEVGVHGGPVILPDCRQPAALENEPLHIPAGGQPGLDYLHSRTRRTEDAEGPGGVKRMGDPYVAPSQVTGVAPGARPAAVRVRCRASLSTVRAEAGLRSAKHSGWSSASRLGG
jgi:hypothetical protein